MALPVAPPPAPRDIAVLDWAGITVRIAWTLLRLGVRVRADVLDEVRGHVLFHVTPEMTGPVAEDLAERRTEEFVARARGRAPDREYAQDWDMPLSERWYHAVLDGLDDVSKLVFRKHYGDHRSLARLADLVAIDILELEGARAGLREVVRRLAETDGLPAQDWPDARIDPLLRRLAAWSPGPCPRPADIVEGFEREHARGCARCDRMRRLVQSSIVTEAQLAAPSLSARPRTEVRVLVLEVHPDAEVHRSAFLGELPVPAFPVGPHHLLLDATELDAIGRALQVAAEVGCPHAEHLRGVVLDGPGAWGEHGLAGPLAEHALVRIERQTWSIVDGLDPLPPELPPAPSATAAWSGTVVLLSLFAGMAGMAVSLPRQLPSAALTADFTSARQGTWAVFDVPETHWVSIATADQEGRLTVLLHSRTASDKITYAVGDGSYRLHAPGQGLLIASHAGPLADLEDRVTRANASSDPLAALAEALHDDADVRVHR